MPIDSDLARLVPQPQRRNGEIYHLQGRVRLVAEGPSGLSYRVTGSRVYSVLLTARDGSLAGSCSCPFFASTAIPCKHLWAAILAAEEDGRLEGLGLELDVAPFAANPAGAAAPTAPWRRLLRALQPARPTGIAPKAADPDRTRIVPVVDLSKIDDDGRVAIRFEQLTRRADGTWGKPRQLGITFGEAESLPSVEDRRLFALLQGIDGTAWGYYGPRRSERIANPAWVPPGILRDALERVAATGRGVVQSDPDGERHPLRLDDGETWALEVELGGGEGSAGYAVIGRLVRGEETIPVDRPDLFLAAGFFFERGTLSRFDGAGAFPLLAELRGGQDVEVPRADAPALVGAILAAAPDLPLRVPDELTFVETHAAPEPEVRILKRERFWGESSLVGVVRFGYEGILVEAESSVTTLVDSERRRLVRRDVAAEAEAIRTLERAGFRRRPSTFPNEPSGWRLPPGRLPGAVRDLLRAGWRVEAEGRLYRNASSFRVEVVSGIDWFDLHAGARFGDEDVPLPRLLAALRKGEAAIPLGDGTFGVLPEAWLERYAPMAGVGEEAEGALRFRANQIGFLDALLATMPEVSGDAVFAKARGELRKFEGLQPIEAPAGFRGELRPYQKDGLGWFRFLRDFGFGGCLADDMGLGKTVQVLALLASRRRRAKGARHKPSLVVAPRSLIFNWIEEARRFTPRLRVVNHTGFERSKAAERFDEADLVLTTYGTLRRDAETLRAVEFDYVVLDEAQAIKNAGSQAAKAARLLRGDHRLALSGTPIENHLGELWSLFDFLNPGMLGASPAFRLGAAAGRDADGSERKLLARAIRPFVLRRTKAEVARDLPARTDQTLVCELGPAQRAHYDEIRDHYRRSLLDRVRRDGIARSKIHVLEALLRLRQAAIHPGLLDPRRAGEPSAKLDLLQQQLAQLLEERHKALVFSQFTSFLQIVRGRLDAQGTPYAYLDGSTPARERADAVRRFQEDPGCPLFLLSLKAGGLGLNLTAAEYVFLLDPWWNPAVEAQAIDRAHRIGQRKPVFAYRVLAAGTIEEKILALQESKRALADAILEGGSSVLRDLSREDLEMLLG